MAKRKCKHDWYISDGKFKKCRMVRAEETCDKYNKKRWVRVVQA